MELISTSTFCTNSLSFKFSFHPRLLPNHRVRSFFKSSDLEMNDEFNPLGLGEERSFKSELLKELLRGLRLLAL